MLGQFQRGVVLAVSLIILVFMTLLVFSMLRTSVLELMMGAGSYTADQNFSNAEAALTKFLNDNNGRFSVGCLTAPNAANCFCTNPNAAQCHAANVGGNATTYVAAPASLIIAGGSLNGARQTSITAQQLSGCVTDAARGSGNQMTTAGGIGLGAVYFDVEARTFGALSGQAIVHQGIKSFCQQ